jgi:energy-coupling factor transporter ATP-binding protein EcfA2
VGARQIMTVLETLMAGRTVILVSHRTGHAEVPVSRVLRLDHGTLVPAGQAAVLGAGG